jgi:PST family polysaccharide transporter
VSGGIAPADLRERALRGVAWSAVERWGGQLMNLAVFVVLVRLVPPEAFGLVALATVFIAFAEAFVDQGLGDAVIQRKSVDPEHLDTAFWMNLAAGVLFAALTVALAAPIAELLREPRLAPVLRWLALLFPIAALNGVQQSLFERDLDFRVLSLRSLAAIVAGGVAGLGAAFLGYGVWALVAQEVVRRAVAAAMLWVASAWRPGLRFSWVRLRELLAFGANSAGIRLLNFANTRSDDLMIGYVLGPVQLGLYSVAYRGTRMITGVLTSMVARIAFPVFARLQGDPVRLRRAFYLVTQHMSLVSFPVFVGMAVAAPDIVAAMFGPRWAASVPVMRVLAFIGILHSLFFFNSTVVMSMGRPGLRLALNTLNAVANVAAFLLVVRWGIVAVAAAFVVRGYLLSPLPLWAVHSLIDIDLKTYLKRFVAPAVATGVMAAAIAAVRMGAEGWVSSPWVMVALDIGVGVLVYAVTLRMLAPSVVRESLELIGQVLSAGGRRGTVPSAGPVEPPPVEASPLG